jgi:hypothetical protein
MVGYEVNFTFIFPSTELAMVSEMSVFLDLQQQTKNKMSERQQNEARVYKKGG